MSGAEYDPRGTDFCQMDASESTVTYLRCPSCGSDDVGCESTTEHHKHECFDCGFKTVAAPTTRLTL